MAKDSEKTNIQFEQVMQECRNLFEKKLHDYGASWRILRPQSLTDQLFIKAKRIRSLEIKKESLVGEGIRPEFIALINYGIVGLIQLAHGFSDTVDMQPKEAIALYGSDPRMFSSTVKEIIKDENGCISEIVTIEIIKETDENGRRVIREKKGTEKTLACDMLIIAAGFAGCEDYVTASFGIEKNDGGTVKTGKGGFATEIPGVFAAGDVRRGQSLVVWAIAEGRACARETDLYLMEYTNM